MYFKLIIFVYIFFTPFSSHPEQDINLRYVQGKVGFSYGKHFFKPVGIDRGDVANWCKRKAAETG